MHTYCFVCKEFVVKNNNGVLGPLVPASGIKKMCFVIGANEKMQWLV